jgi:hypothetical protein
MSAENFKILDLETDKHYKVIWDLVKQYIPKSKQQIMFKAISDYLETNIKMEELIKCYK